MNKKDADAYQFRLAIVAAKIYYLMSRTSDILCGNRPQKIGMSLGPAVYHGLRWR